MLHTCMLMTIALHVLEIIKMFYENSTDVGKA